MSYSLLSLKYCRSAAYVCVCVLEESERRRERGEKILQVRILSVDIDSREGTLHLRNYWILAIF